MGTMNASQARNHIGQLWASAAHEPVVIESAGKPIAVVMSPEEYAKLTLSRKPRQPGTMKHLFQSVSVDELLAVPIDDAFAEYMP